MTTDTVAKVARFTHADGWVVGGMAKGAGMLAPGLATMLVVITTDAVLDSKDLDVALRAATRVTFDRLDSDGCMSTNDQVTLMASGASNLGPSVEEFTEALTAVCQELAAQLLTDAEGSAHDIAIKVVGAASEEDAVKVGRSVARNNLFKAAIYGNDPNWGRILAAVGVTKAAFDPYDIDVEINGVSVSRKGQPDQSRDLVDLTPRAVQIRISLNAGASFATIYTNDLTHEYVTENSAYSS
jgi:glutamate N-acetyltransferase/amino-acid N-acetyltransferase